MKTFLPIHLLIILLILLSLGAILTYNGLDGISWLKHLWNLATIFFSSYAVSFLLQRFFKFPPAKIEHRIITALILFLLFDPFLASWMFCLIGAFAELAQRLIRTQIGPVFNPAGFTAFIFGLLMMVPSWWGVTFLPYVTLPYTEVNVSVAFFLIVPVAGYVAYRYRKLPILFSFLLVFIFMNGIFFGRNPIPLVIDSFMAFFLFIMVVEPKTSPVSLKDQWMYGGVIGILMPVLPKLGSLDATLVALLLANLYTARKFLLSKVRSVSMPGSPLEKLE